MILLGYVHDGIAYLATDTRVVVSDRKRNELSPSNYKIKKLNSGLIVGIVGEKCARQRLLASSDLFTLDKQGKLTKQHIVKNIIPKLHDFLSENGLYEVGDDHEQYLDCEILLAHEDKIYYIDGSLWTFRAAEYIAVGEMRYYCFSALEEVDKGDNIGEQLAGIMQRATTYTNFIGGPYIHINTKDEEFCVTEAK